MATHVIRGFVDATIAPEGDAISVRLETDTDAPLVLDFATATLEAAVLPLIAALDRAHEKAGALRAAEQRRMLLPMHLAGARLDLAAAANDAVLELRLAPGRLPLRFSVSPAAAAELMAQLTRLAPTGPAGRHAGGRPATAVTDT